MTQTRRIACIHDENDLPYSGWEIRTEELGYDPSHTGGTDYRNARHPVIARLNNGYGGAGTIPLPQFYDSFAVRVQNFVTNSQGCEVWIIGNEMNHGSEWPFGHPIYPSDYAACYTLCRDRIHGLPGHEQDQVLIGAVAPYNAQTQYPGNPTGDWVIYFEDIIKAAPRIDGFAFHAYSSNQEPNIIVSDARMGAPFEHLSSEFRTYQDFMYAIPEPLWGLPVYITEANPGARGAPWRNENTGWIRAAYDEIARWNAQHYGGDIRALGIYCWDRRGDGMWIRDKPNVIQDFMQAADRGLEWEPEPPVEPEPPEPEPPEPPACDCSERLDALEVQVAQQQAQIAELFDRLRIGAMGLEGGT